jgi:hypothetical protein
MPRVIGIPALLMAVFVGVYLTTQNMQSTGTTSTSEQQAITDAQSATAGVNFAQVVPSLQAYFDLHHTYAGAPLPDGSQVTLARADATSYCLQSGDEHEVGPGGSPQPGPC